MSDIITNATAIKSQKKYYKLGKDFYLQNATVLLQNPTVITKCNDLITKSIGIDFCKSFWFLWMILRVLYRNEYLSDSKWLKPTSILGILRI